MIKLVLAKDIDFKNWKIQFFTALNQVVFPMYQKIILEIGFECKNLLNFICNTMKFNPILHEWGGPLWPPYHESVCRCHKVRAIITKVPDFVPFDTCQVPESRFWCLFFKKLKKLDVENFLGSSSIRRKSE